MSCERGCGWGRGREGGEAKASHGHDAWCMHTRDEGQGLDPRRVWGVLLSATRLPVGGYGGTPRWRWLPVKGSGGRGGAVGAGVAAGARRVRGGGGGGAVSVRVGVRARGWGCGELSRRAPPVRLTGAEERLRLAKVGRGARGARGAGAAVSDGARTPLGGDESRRASSTGANPGGGGGSAAPSPRGRTGPGRAPPDGYRGGGRGWYRGSEARVPGVRGPARGRPGGPLGCGW